MEYQIRVLGLINIDQYTLHIIIHKQIQYNTLQLNYKKGKTRTTLSLIILSEQFTSPFRHVESIPFGYPPGVLVIPIIEYSHDFIQWSRHEARTWTYTIHRQGRQEPSTNSRGLETSALHHGFSLPTEPERSEWDTKRGSVRPFVFKCSMIDTWISTELKFTEPQWHWQEHKEAWYVICILYRMIEWSDKW